MNTSSAAADLNTAMAAACAVLNVFTTGKGNTVGNPITPVLKVCANPKACEYSAENIDINISGIMSRELTLEQAGDEIIEGIVRTARGRWTATEVLKHDEFTPLRLFPQS